MDKFIKIFSAFMACALIFIAVPTKEAEAGFTVIPEGHVGIVIHWGEAQEETLLPGFHWTPFLSSVEEMDTRWQKYSTTTSAFSKDIQQVDISVSMSYQLLASGARNMYKTVGMNYADQIMLPRLLDALKSTFAKYSAEELISNRETISTEILLLLRDQLEFYSVSVREIAIEDIDFTDAFTDAIEAKQVATQRKLQVETEQEQQTLIAKAEAERAKLAAETEAEKIRIAAQAQADAVKLAADAEAYRIKMESEYITDETLQKELINRWDGKLPSVTGESTPVLSLNPYLPELTQ